jgi:hypothetical protein
VQPSFWGLFLGAAIGAGIALRNAYKSAYVRTTITIDATAETPAYRSVTSRFGAGIDDLKERFEALLAKAQAIDGIRPAPAGSVLTPDQSSVLKADRLRAVEQHVDRILELDRDRRWVADRGWTSHLERPLLTIITSLDVADYLAAGQTVFVVCGEKPVDTLHKATIRASNLRQSNVYVWDAAWVVRCFNYRLVPITNPAGLDHDITSGDGIPEGLIAIYRDANASCRLVASRDTIWSSEVWTTGSSLFPATHRRGFSSERSMKAVPELDLRSTRHVNWQTGAHGTAPVFGIVAAIIAAAGSRLTGMSDSQALLAITLAAFTVAAIADLSLHNWRHMP